jgi:hypothetical protein
MRPSGCKNSWLRISPEAVEDEVAINSHLQFAAAFFELPGVQPAMSRQTQIDAVVIGQVLRLLWWDRFAKYDGEPTTAIRMSGPIRTAIMSFATCSPDRPNTANEPD